MILGRGPYRNHASFLVNSVTTQIDLWPPWRQLVPQAGHPRCKLWQGSCSQVEERRDRERSIEDHEPSVFWQKVGGLKLNERLVFLQLFFGAKHVAG